MINVVEPPEGGVDFSGESLEDSDAWRQGKAELKPRGGRNRVSENHDATVAAKTRSNFTRKGSIRTKIDTDARNTYTKRFVLNVRIDRWVWTYSTKMSKFSNESFVIFGKFCMLT